MNDLNLLHAAICANPDDDTLRLVYADLLDGLDPVRVPCKACDGSGVYRNSYRDYPFGNKVTEEGPCVACSGSRTLLDTADADRAEFIRASIAQEHGSLYCFHDLTKPTDCRGCNARRLYERHGAEWRKCPCPECGGGGNVGDEWCPLCDGARDLFRRAKGQNGASEPRTVHFRRGFIDSVECVADDVWREGVCPQCGGAWSDRIECRACSGRGTSGNTVPTEWAKAVVRCAPVTRFVLTDKTPTRNTSNGAYMLVRKSGMTNPPPDELPSEVFDFLEPNTHFFHVFGRPGDWRSWPSEQAARDALALAIGRWVRAHA